MKTRIMAALVSIIMAIGLFFYVKTTACNKPGSVAEKINWAGHNCPR